MVFVLLSVKVRKQLLRHKRCRSGQRWRKSALRSIQNSDYLFGCLSDVFVWRAEHPMSVARGLKVVGYFDCPGGGQVVVRDGVAYIGHVKPPNGTTLVDVSDPVHPRKLSEIKVPQGTLSHKVRVDNGIMLVNREIFPIGRKIRTFAADSRCSTSPSLRRPAISARGRPEECIGSRSTAATSTARPNSTAISAMSCRSSTSRNRTAPKKLAAGGCRGNGPPAARSRPGRTPRIAAIIRCASEIAFMSVTGMAASSFSTSRT